MNKKIKTIVVSAVLAAIEFVVTYLIAIPVPAISGAYVNAGDAVIYAGSFYFGSVFTAVALGVGSALADLMMGAAMYVIPTFLIKTAMSLVCYAILKKGRSLKMYVFSAAIGGLVMLGGYFLTECIYYGAALAAVGLLNNLGQYVFGILLALPLYYGLRRVHLEKI
ncbi:MAG: ECF transporter S component [Christensenellaceae bacterium]|jgi:uncharacterized membrane protein